MSKGCPVVGESCAS
ncbi:predicted protein [Fibroporia radiculosa]|uniref:Uncharacterized protein n=1 Tax=Fibroporia radiculosa TaxID=599839 RepID=J7RVR9_9APHY|nr:predicted protein [Fibroporia radiculosa]